MGVGETHQPQSIEWAMQHGASFIRVESIRGKRELHLASASAPLGQKIRILSNEAKEALCSKTVEIKEMDARQNQMVSHFLALPESTQLRSSLVVTHRKTADRLNQWVHEQRRAMQENTVTTLTLENLAAGLFKRASKATCSSLSSRTGAALRKRLFRTRT